MSSVLPLVFLFKDVLLLFLIISRSLDLCYVYISAGVYRGQMMTSDPWSWSLCFTVHVWRSEKDSLQKVALSSTILVLRSLPVFSATPVFLFSILWSSNSIYKIVSESYVLKEDYRDGPNCTWVCLSLAMTKSRPSHLQI
jgi:hypothetical protein